MKDNKWCQDKEYRKKISEGLKIAYKEGRKNPIRYWLGKHQSEETKAKIRQKALEQFKDGMPIETRKKLSKIRKGRVGYWKGKKQTEENKKRISDTLKRKGHRPPKRFGKDNPAWNNGSSFKPYSVDWTKTLKKSIRERDKYTCQICGKEPAIMVHHIDYDKKNCNPDNLITLCNKCHGKTNHNREYWKNYLKIKIKKYD